MVSGLKTFCVDDLKIGRFYISLHNVSYKRKFHAFVEELETCTILPGGRRCHEHSKTNWIKTWTQALGDFMLEQLCLLLLTINYCRLLEDSSVSSHQQKHIAHQVRIIIVFSFGIPKRHHFSPPLSLGYLKSFGFFWLWSTGPFLPRPISLWLRLANFQLRLSLSRPKGSLVTPIASLAAKKPASKAEKLLKSLLESSSFSRRSLVSSSVSSTYLPCKEKLYMRILYWDVFH